MATITIQWNRMPGYIILKLLNESGEQVAEDYYGGEPEPNVVEKYLRDIGQLNPENVVQHREGKDPYKIGPSFAHSNQQDKGE